MGDWELVRGADREIDRFSARDDDLERRVHAFWVGEREIGILGLDKEEVSRPGLNGFGVALACLALYVASKIDGTTNSNSNSNSSSNSNSNSTSGMRKIDVDEEREDNAFLNNNNNDEDEALRKKQTFGITLSLLSGVLYGVNFNPAENLRLRSGAHSDDALDYVFLNYYGIFGTTLVAFALHYLHVVRKATDRYPELRQETIVPAFISGVMWGIAQTSWFVANRVLSMSISFPIIALSHRSSPR